MGSNVPYKVKVLVVKEEEWEIYALHEGEAEELAKREDGVIRVLSVTTD